MSEEKKLDKFELEDDVLEAVAGGRYDPNGRTQMRCTACGYTTVWDGDLRGQYRWCGCKSSNGQNTLYGEKLV